MWSSSMHVGVSFGHDRPYIVIGDGLGFQLDVDALAFDRLAGSLGRFVVDFRRSIPKIIGTQVGFGISKVFVEKPSGGIG